MDNGEHKITPEGLEKLNNEALGNWTPENPEHNLSSLGNSAIGSSTITSSPDSEPLPQPDGAFDIKDVFPDETNEANVKDSPKEEPRLIFEPSSITPQEEGLSPVAKSASHSISDLIIRGDNPREAYTNYQALRKAVSSPSTASGEQEK